MTNYHGDIREGPSASRLAMPAGRPARSDLNAPTRWRVHRFTLAFSLVVIAVIAAWPYLPRRYVATTSLILHASERDADLPGLSLDDGAVQSEMDRISSAVLLGRVADSLGLDADQELFRPSWPLGIGGPVEILDKLQQRISVSRERKAYTLRISVWDHDPKRASDIANALVGVYIDDQIARKKQAIEAQTYGLEERVAALKSKVAQDHEAVRALMASAGVSDRDNGSDLQSLLSTLSGELAHMQARAIEARVRSQSLSEMQRTGALFDAPEVVGSSSVQRARETLAAQEALVAARANPMLAAETSSLKEHVEEEARRVVKAAAEEASSLMGSETRLRDEVAKAREEVIRRRLNELKLDELRHVSDTDEVALNESLGKLKAQIGRTVAIQPDVDLVARAQPPRKAAFPDPVLAAVGTLLTACLAGAAAAGSRRVFTSGWAKLTGLGRKAREEMALGGSRA